MPSTYTYAGFSYTVDAGGRLSADPGQHPAAGRTRNLMTAQCEFDTEQRERAAQARRSDARSI